MLSVHFSPAKHADDIDMDISRCPNGSNLIFIPGRVHDMLNHMNASYNAIFEMKPTLPPIGDDVSWDGVSPEKVWSDTLEGSQIRNRYCLFGHRQVHMPSTGSQNASVVQLKADKSI